MTATVEVPAKKTAPKTARKNTKAAPPVSPLAAEHAPLTQGDFVFYQESLGQPLVTSSIVGLTVGAVVQYQFITSTASITALPSQLIGRDDHRPSGLLKRGDLAVVQTYQGKLFVVAVHDPVGHPHHIRMYHSTGASWIPKAEVRVARRVDIHDLYADLGVAVRSSAAPVEGQAALTGWFQPHSGGIRHWVQEGKVLCGRVFPKVLTIRIGTPLTHGTGAT